MAIMSTDYKPQSLVTMSVTQDTLDHSTGWQMGQSWTKVIDKLQKWTTHVEGLSPPKVIKQKNVLMFPRHLKSMIPMSSPSAQTVANGRRVSEDIIHFKDDRLLVLVGPCSIHDPDAAREYAQKLKVVADKLSGDLHVVMRAYFEKPRTTVGWKGLVTDPDLNGSSNLNKGLYEARQICSDLTHLGLPIAGEILDLVTPTYYADFISVGAIGARTTESQPHRALSSSLPFPIGFKNGTNGSVDVAVNGITSAASSHTFPSLTDNGATSIVDSDGNPDCFVILRGGDQGPNFSADHVGSAHKTATCAGHNAGIMVDCSHGNSNKDYRNQTKVAADVASQIERGDSPVIGVMIESNLKEGKQALTDQGLAGLERGKSITDGCIGWDSTVEVLEMLAQAARRRREVVKASAAAISME